MGIFVDSGYSLPYDKLSQYFPPFPMMWADDIATNAMNS